MVAYESQARLLHVWRTAIAGRTQAEVAEYLCTNKATISMWEHAKRGLTFEAVDDLDDCYFAGGALADMAQALGTPFALPARRPWIRYPSGAYGTGWALLRPGPGQRHLGASFSWGPLSFRISEPCDDDGILLQLPISAPDVVIDIRLDEPGWVDFGRGLAHPELGIPVHKVPASRVLVANEPLPPGLVSPGLAARFARDPAFADAVLQVFEDRPDLARQAFAARPARSAAAEVLVVDRPHPYSGVPRFTGEQYRTLRHGRCLTLSDAASRASALLPGEPVSADRVRRFERGAEPQAKQLRARLDHVYDAGGHTCNERVDVKNYRSPFTVMFPQYWVGPVWFAFSSDRDASTDVHIQRRSAHQRLVVVPGASVTCTRSSVDDADPFTIECPYGWTVTAGLGARPAAPELHLPNRATGTLDPVTPGGGEVNDDLLSLFGRTHKDLEQLLQQHDKHS